MSPFLLASIVGAVFAVGGMIWSWVRVSAQRNESASEEDTGGRKDIPQAEISTDQLVVGDVPQEPVAFQSRPELLNALSRGSPTGVSVVHAVTGMRGVGKTQVAAEYARLRIAQGWRLVAWVDASTQDSMLAGLKTVAEAEGLALAREDTGATARVVRH
jgi:hypothetical protein